MTFLTEAVELGRLDVPRRLKMRQHLHRLQEVHDGFHGPALKEVNYSSAVITLYGALERFGESSLEEYVRYLNAACPAYDLLPEALRQAHLAATWRAVQSPDIARLGSAAEFVADLHSCLHGVGHYRLTPATFAYHTANFRHGLFQELWAHLGVPNVTASIQEDGDYVAAVEAVDPGESSRSFYRFDDIAERRNEIAHGASISELLSLDLVLQYVDIVEAFASALVRRVRGSALEVLVQHTGRPRGEPIAVYDNKIVCLHCKDDPLEVGDILVGVRPDGEHLGSPIECIQVEGESVSSVDSDQDVEVGLEVAFPAKENQQFWSVPRAGPVGDAWEAAFA